jgi:hypothetical protein
MNLNYDTTPEALKEFIMNIAAPSMADHNIALDYDGEVLIDPELHYPDVDIKRYQFCTKVKTSVLRTDEVVKVLQEALLTVFETQHKDIGYFDNFRIAA